MDTTIIVALIAAGGSVVAALIAIVPHLLTKREPLSPKNPPPISDRSPPKPLPGKSPPISDPTPPKPDSKVVVRRYPDWEPKKTPDTDSRATICRFRHVENVRVIHVVDASYRSAKYSETFELADQTRSDPVGVAPGGKRTAEVICAWHGVIPRKTYPQLTLVDGQYTIEDGYTGEVADNIGRANIVTPRV